MENVLLFLWLTSVKVRKSSFHIAFILFESPPTHTHTQPIERSTQYPEEDVYIAESRYNEAEKKTVKFKGFKVHTLV